MLEEMLYVNGSLWRLTVLAPGKAPILPDYGIESQYNTSKRQEP